MTNIGKGMRQGWRWSVMTLVLGTLVGGMGLRAGDVGAALEPLPVTLSQRLTVDAVEARTLLPDGRWLTLDRSGSSLQLSDAADAHRFARTWPLPQSRRLASLTLLPSGRVLIWGGVDERGKPHPTGFWFDPATQALTPATKIGLVPRAGHTATVLTDGRLLVTGGWAAGIGGMAKAELWDERSGVVSVPDSELVPPRLGHRAVLQANGRVRLSGGLDAQSRHFQRDLLFDPTTQRFVAASDKAAPDAESPALAASIPQAKATAVAPDARLALRFTAPLRVSGLNASSVTLFGPSGRAAIQVVPAEQGRVLFVTPHQALFPNSNYTLLVEGGYSAAGKPLPLVAVDFRTAALTSDGTPTPAPLPHNQGAQHLSTGPGRTQVPCGANGAHLHPCRAAAAMKDGVWFPGQDNTDGRWRIYGESQEATPNANMSRLAALYHVTVVRGRVVQVDQKPVANVEVSIGRHTARTNADGWFLLFDVPAGQQELYVDGTTANHGDVEYGQFVVGVQVKKGKLTEVPYLMHLPRITARDKVRIPSPLTQDVVLTHPDMPGLEVQIPAGTVIRDRKGRLVTELAIVPTPVNRAPYPVPENFPMYFTVEPGGAVIQGLTREAAKGVRIVYPNYDGHARGTVSNFWIYDPKQGWRIYGQGEVHEDGHHFDPEHGVGLHEMMGGGHTIPSTDPPPEPDQPNCNEGCGSSGSGGGAVAGDPIDLRTGSFLHSETDIAISDLMPITLGRSYRQHDLTKRAFGIGTAANSDYSLYRPSTTGYAQLYVVLPNGSYVPFDRETTDSNTLHGTWRQNGSTTMFNGAVLYSGWYGNMGEVFLITLRDGRRMWFDISTRKLNRIEDRNGNAVDLTFEAGLLKKVTSPSGRYITLTHDTSNRIATAKDHTGRTWSYAYYNGLLSQVTYPDGTSQSITYDVTTDPQVVANAEHIATHIVKSMTNRRGVRELLNSYPGVSGTTVDYRITKQTLADGKEITIDYAHSDGSTTGVLVTQADGSKRRIVFDQGRYPKTDTTGYGTALAQTVTFERASDSERITARTDPQGRRTEFQYNSTGQATQVTYLAGTLNAKVMQMTYTGEGDLATVTDPLGRKTTFSYTDRCLTRITDPMNRVTEIVCNGGGQPLSVTDPMGNTTLYHYDGFELTAVVDPLGRATGFAYDALGRLIVVRDPEGKISRREYDSDGRVKKVIDPSGNTTELAYDGNGNLTAVLLPHGNGVTYTYDSRDRLLERRDSLNQAETWAHDAIGRVTAYTDRKQQTTQYRYDVLGRPTTTTYADGSTQTASYDGGSRLLQLEDSVAGTLSWQYDVFDRVIQAASPEGTIGYEYDAAGRRIGMTAGSQPKVEYQYDAGDQLTRILQGSDVVEFQYDALGRRTQLTLPNGVKTGYAYDAASQLTGIAYLKADNTAIGDLGYAYNTVGQRTAQTGSLASNLLPTASTGNAFDDNNRQTQYQGQALSYDANGNLTGDGQRSYVWNARNQLVEIRQGGQTIAQFTYDALGRRKAKTEGASTAAYLYDGLDPVQETQGGATRGILTGARIDERFARDDANGRTYFLTDALGSTRALMNNNGDLIQRYDYTPYGQTQASNAGTSNPYQYTGRELDQTGLYYYRARYYHPGMGRFISEDPLGFGGGDWNIYAYVGGNPIVFIDPDGRFLVNVVTAGIGAIVGGGSNLAMQLLQNGGNLGCVDWGDVGIATGVGAVAGALAPFAATGVMAAGLGGASNVVQYGLTQWSNGNAITGQGMAWNALTGAGGGLIGGGFTRAGLRWDEASPWLDKGVARAMNDSNDLALNAGTSALLRNAAGGMNGNLPDPRDSGGGGGCGCK